MSSFDIEFSSLPWSKPAIKNEWGLGVQGEADGELY